MMKCRGMSISMASRIGYERALNGGKSLYGPAGQEYVPPTEYMV